MKMSKSEAGRIGYAASKETIKRKKAERISHYMRDPRKCAFCTTILPYKKRANTFCSHSCSAKNNNPKNRKYTEDKLEFCANCNKKLIGAQRKYCSRLCSGKHRAPKAIKAGTACDRTLRKHLLGVRGEACENCKLELWNGMKIPLELDHIDGNSENNDLENLQIVCPNCHAQTPTYRAKNRGSGRHKRRQRYAENKSW